MARIELEHASKGLRLGNRKLSHLPPRLITGAYIVNAGVSKLGAGEETAKRLHGMATAAYPLLGKLDAQTFTRLLGAGELTLGASLLLPIVPRPWPDSGWRASPPGSSASTCESRGCARTAAYGRPRREPRSPRMPGCWGSACRS